MPRDLERKKERGAIAVQPEEHGADRADVNPASARETIVNSRTHTRGGERREDAAAPSRDIDGDSVRRTLRHRPEKAAEPDGNDPVETPADAPDAGEPVLDDISRSRGGREPSGAAKRSRLNFTKAEAAPRADTAPGSGATPQSKSLSEKAAAARRRADKADEKLERARENLPKTHTVRVERTFDEQKNKFKRKLVFEEEVRSKSRHLKGSPVTRPVRAGANAAMLQAHRKIHEVEHENVGVEAGHKAELAAEGGLRYANRRRKTAPYRKAARRQAKAARLNVRADYRKALADNPKLNKSLFSRMAQKRKIKRGYAKAVRQAQKTARRARQAGGAARSVGGFVSRHPVASVVILLASLLVLLIVSIFSSFGNLASDGAGALLATSYLAPDADIDAAELAYTEWETDLLIEINNTETTRPGFDEYRYSVDDIGHGPHELMAYLTAAHEEFSFPGIEAALRAIFDEQYQLAYTETTETRYNDPEDADGDGDTEPYDWKILTVTLTAQSFTDVIAPKLGAEQAQRYTLLTRIKGNRQYVGSPFDFNWLPYVSDSYGWRVHPIGGNKDNHRAVDIAVATGTEIIAAHDGTVTFAGNSGGYGLVVFLSGDEGVETRYAHCSEILVAQGQSVTAGTVIAKVGSTGNSTGPHLHFEVLKDGGYLNPMYFAITNDDGSSYIPPGSPGGRPIPEYPGAPMDDSRFAAMMEEAQKHLGKPYVFGASGPNSFDCSGFVSYVLSHSAYPGFGRTTAQGLYNMCTPVSRADAMPGDLIFFTGTYNAGRPVTHIGIYIGNGQMIHAGKPVQYASIDTPYWTSHYYAMGRLP